MNIAAYELLYRNGPANRAAFADGDRATGSVLSNTLDIGLKNVCGGHLAYVNCTRNFIEGRLPIPFNGRQMVVEVLETEMVDRALVESLRELKRLGFQIALDDFQLTPMTEPLLEVANIIKLDVRELSPRLVAEHLGQFKGLRATLLAEKVETAASLERCIDAGFDLFQGYFLSRPQLVQGQQKSIHRDTVEELLATTFPHPVLA